jgi:hypothetical protein
MTNKKRGAALEEISRRRPILPRSMPSPSLSRTSAEIWAGQEQPHGSPKAHNHPQRCAPFADAVEQSAGYVN